jgi:hypothetical protein
MRRVFGSVFALLAMITLSAAQTTPQPANPLRPGSARSAPANPPAAAAPDAETARPKRQRSPAQLANDNRMRACGAEWRANKARLTAQGQNWRSFNVECRARLKAQGR